MNRSWKLFTATLAAALLVGSVAVFWLWRDYVLERAANQQVLVVRGESVLAALEGGIRSHRRLGNWFTTNLDVVLDETATAAGVQGLAIFKEDGSLFAKGTTFPDSLHPSYQAQWSDAGILICRKSKIESQGGPGTVMRRRGWGRDGGESFTPGESPDLDALLQNPIWLAVLIDGSDFRAALAKARWRFLLSLAATLVSILLGAAAVSLIQRHGRLRAELGLAREREKRLGEMALLGAGLAHETKNPLGLIRGLAQSLAGRLAHGDDKARGDAQQIVDEADRVVSRINAFLTYARPKAPNREAIDLAAIIQETAGLFRDEAAAKGVALKVSARPLPIEADPDQVRQIVVNLIANAVAACDSGREIEVAVGKEGDPGFLFSVRDTGEGIAPEDLPEVTQPYFTRRAGGTGLGLAIVQQIVDAHQWRLDIRSAPGEGCIVEVRK